MQSVTSPHTPLWRALALRQLKKTWRPARMIPIVLKMMVSGESLLVGHCKGSGTAMDILRQSIVEDVDVRGQLFMKSKGRWSEEKVGFWQGLREMVGKYFGYRTTIMENDGYLCWFDPCEDGEGVEAKCERYFLNRYSKWVVTLMIGYLSREGAR